MASFWPFFRKLGTLGTYKSCTSFTQKKRRVGWEITPLFNFLPPNAPLPECISYIHKFQLAIHKCHFTLYIVFLLLSHIRAQLLGMYSTVRSGGMSQDRANTFSPPHQSNYIMQRASCGLRPATRTELHCIMYSNRKPKSTKKIEDYSFCYCFNKTKGVE